MLKARRLAYDGKGNAVVSCAEDAPAAYARLAAAGALFVEKWVPFRRELAVIVARPRGGGAPVAYPAVETVQQDSVCHVVLAPAAITGDVRARAEAVAAQAIAALDAGAAGVFGVELFELCDGRRGGVGHVRELYCAVRAAPVLPHPRRDHSPQRDRPARPQLGSLFDRRVAHVPVRTASALHYGAATREVRSLGAREGGGGAVYHASAARCARLVPATTPCPAARPCACLPRPC